jgi:hypothetical protein
MKLYTEEQVREAIKLADKHHYLYDLEDDGIINQLNPIELPSDEDIDKYIEKTFYGVKKHYFKAGVEFMKELIVKQNK